MKIGISKAGDNNSNGHRVFATDASRRQAVLRRDPQADGHFVYSVKTTGVYCRPSCGARAAKVENVQFHDSARTAEHAGFRPCKRCKPNATSLRERYASMVAAACRAIEGAETAPDLVSLAKSVGMSPFHFQRVFKKVAGVSPKAYATAHRAEQMRAALKRRNSVTEAIYEAGFSSSSRFYEKASEMLGMRPKIFLENGRGGAVRFAVGKCSLGRVLAATSEKGVCAILIGDNHTELAGDLRRRFPEARLIPGDRQFQRVLRRVVEFVDAPSTQFELPLDLQGTLFQRKVWTALRGVPAGSTTTYAEIAKRIGRPKAVRAVAGAIAANPVAVAIPCHRIIRSNGELCGYHWGVERKRALLSKESKR